MLGSGVLLLGPSGIGKSECALDLVTRGHALVADDVVRLRAEGGALSGTAPETIRFFMEIRGVGLLYLPDLYGADSVRERGPVDLVCKLEEWREGADFDRIGEDQVDQLDNRSVLTGFFKLAGIYFVVVVNNLKINIIMNNQNTFGCNFIIFYKAGNRFTAIIYKKCCFH